MKAIKKIFATLFTGLMSFPFVLTAQNEATYIDNLGVQDSSYMETDLLNEAQNSGSGTTVIIIFAIVLVVLADIFLLMKKKKTKQ